nr:MAG TPA: hypothetical protein [Caudoviricetes sp.]
MKKLQNNSAYCQIIQMLNFCEFFALPLDFKKFFP